ncbi:von Willebrand factor A domain-containing protein 5A [Triangularia verruculosa]|uniref:von Willebrand factor A domain-containing protein 5A n=1 Tax=Triangularia verruculosa TaxID=2587418 RepID=A0AAN6XI69_9PEZI|nr:von Willebrand factor A domain-containing protein 5A [Triangularia verruculosa]
MTRISHVCGLYYAVPGQHKVDRHYLPQVSLSVNTKIVSSTSRTTLTQTFVNPKSDPIPELRYTFPLYDGVSVVGFVCTINDDRVIHGVVKERSEARKTYKAAVDRGESAGLLEQLPNASDVFTTTFGRIPANATLKVEITYLGELKHDAEVDGIRFTIPTSIAPRYGNYPGELLQPSSSTTSAVGTGISAVVDVEMPEGSNVKNVQSPSHPISVTLGNTSAGAASGADMSLQKASATLAMSTTELGDDFVLQVVATNFGRPMAVLETHPTLPNHRALMATLVPKFNLPSSKPEIVFLCDRSGSMGGEYTIPNLKKALHVFLKSLPVGVKFNICSFGDHHEFLFKDGSRTYDQSSLAEAARYVDTFAADFGGTDIYKPMKSVLKKRHADMDLEVFLLTDGEIWDQNLLFGLLNEQVAESKGRVRVFSLGIGNYVSHALIEGVAAAGNGFSQSVGDKENMNSKVVRMLKASLTPHVIDYTLDVKYGQDEAAAGTATESDDDFEIVEKVMDALVIDVQEAAEKEDSQKPISLYDESANPDVEMTDASLDTAAGGKYSHAPPVSEPKILQAPFKIPPLFPFNRTSVYLLLSPETIQKQPKSVVLRGTSPHGPVELEIPVTVLADKSETIHQLAARKAVKELEEGRGWIFHARDAPDPETLQLKEKYPGRFSDMVEREAVRLGVTYQVGGKWCSFVAVEADKSKDLEEKDSSTAEIVQASDSPPSSSPVTARRNMMGLGRGGAFRHRMITMKDLSGPVPPPPPAPAGGNRRARASHPLPPGTTSEQGFSATSTTKLMRLSTGGAARHRRYAGLKRSSDEAENEDSDGSAGEEREGKRPVDKADAASMSDEEKLNLLVAWQGFSGSWKWDEKLVLLLGLQKGVEVPKDVSGGGAIGLEVVATAMVLVYLGGVLGGLRDEWEMLADKAMEWLEGEVGQSGRSVEEFLEGVRGFMVREGVKV